MALDIELQRSPRMIRSKLRTLLETIHLTTKPITMVPLGYVQMTLAGGTGAVPLLNVPVGTTSYVINVEGGSIRYCDGDVAGATYGELWPAGTTFQRTIRPIRSATVCPDGSVALNATAIANVSYYGYVGG